MLPDSVEWGAEVSVGAILLGGMREIESVPSVEVDKTIEGGTGRTRKAPYPLDGVNNEALSRLMRTTGGTQGTSSMKAEDSN